MWEQVSILGAVLLFFEVLGILSAARAVMTARTSQGAIAWALALVTWPLISVPLYWIFGRSKFRGYVSARRSRLTKSKQTTYRQVENSNQYFFDFICKAQ